MYQVFNDDDIVIDLCTQRHVRQYLNNMYGLMKDCIDYNLSVPLDKRDHLYYSCVTVLHSNIQEYEKLITSLYKCKLITYAKKEFILEKLQRMYKALNDNVEVLKHEA